MDRADDFPPHTTVARDAQFDALLSRTAYLGGGSRPEPAFGPTFALRKESRPESLRASVAGPIALRHRSRRPSKHDNERLPEGRLAPPPQLHQSRCSGAAVVEVSTLLVGMS